MEDGFTHRFQDSGDPQVTGRALVPVTIAAARSEASAVRPDPRFVAQLIATAAHAPQTRTLRRAAPADAATSYASTIGRDNACACGVTILQVA